MRLRGSLLCTLCLLAPAILLESRPPRAAAPANEKHLLYVALPGIRNYIEYGGVGVLVYDIDAGYKVLKRIPTWSVPPGQQPENVKGIAASAKTGKLYVSTTKRVACFDLLTDAKLWEKSYDGGSDRLAISPDGKILYVPSFEGPHWNAVDALTGDVLAKIVTKSGAHNTITDLMARAFISPVCNPPGFPSPTPNPTLSPVRLGHSVLPSARSPSTAGKPFASSMSTSCLALKSAIAKPAKCSIAWKSLASRKVPPSATAAPATESRSRRMKKNSGSPTPPTAASTFSTPPQCHPSK